MTDTRDSTGYRKQAVCRNRRAGPHVQRKSYDPVAAQKSPTATEAIEGVLAAKYPSERELQMVALSYGSTGSGGKRRHIQIRPGYALVANKISSQGNR